MDWLSLQEEPKKSELGNSYLIYSASARRLLGAINRQIKDLFNVCLPRCNLDVCHGYKVIRRVYGKKSKDLSINLGEGMGVDMIAMIE
jgi:hypothetical protein